jgi:hypothetical protein
MMIKKLTFIALLAFFNSNYLICADHDKDESGDEGRYELPKDCYSRAVARALSCLRCSRKFAKDHPMPAGYVVGATVGVLPVDASTKVVATAGIIAVYKLQEIQSLIKKAQ